MEVKGSLSWFSPSLGTAMGYGYAASCLLTSLNKARIKTDYDSPRNKVHVSWVQPEWYSGYDGQYKIGYTPWESTEIPDQWVHLMNERDEIWTPTTFCKDIFQHQGVTVPIHVVPHGIDENHYPITERSIGNQFNFLHIGGPTERKGGQLVFDAFQKLFEGQKNIHLYMKSTGPSECRWDLGVDKPMFNVADHPQVTVIDRHLDIYEMKNLYQKCHVMVYPSNGEGFGFIPFQAMATGMPTIATNGTGMSDFAWRSLPLNWEWTNGVGIHLGKWMKPDYNHLVALMADAYYNWEGHAANSMKQAKELHEIQSWDKIAEQIIDILGDRIK